MSAVRRSFFCCRDPKRISRTWRQNIQKQMFRQKPFFTSHPAVFLSRCYRCYLLDGISKGAWLNRSSIIFAGNDKWSVDPRVSIVSSVGDKHEYSLQIKKVDVSDDGQYTCSIQSERNPWPKLLNLIVKGTSAPTPASSFFFLERARCYARRSCALQVVNGYRCGRRHLCSQNACHSFTPSDS